MTLDDLPPGFVLEPSGTSSSHLETVGPVQEVQYRRQITVATLPDPLFVVGQVIMRLDGPMGAGDALREARDTYILHQGMAPSPVGPNDDGTFTLERFDKNNIKHLRGRVHQREHDYRDAHGRRRRPRRRNAPSRSPGSARRSWTP